MQGEKEREGEKRLQTGAFLCKNIDDKLVLLIKFTSMLNEKMVFSFGYVFSRNFTIRSKQTVKFQ